MLNYQRVNIGFVLKNTGPPNPWVLYLVSSSEIVTAFRHKPWYAGLDSTPGLQWAVSLRYHGIPCHLVAFHGTRTVPTACLFVVASNLNSLIGLLSRLMAMERWRSSGLFHVGGPWGPLGILQIHADALKSTKKPRESMVNHHFPDSLTAIV